MLLFTCENHPQVKTKRRCYGCKKPICSACIVKAAPHLFCSSGCYRKYHFFTLPWIILKRRAQKSRRHYQRLSLPTAFAFGAITVLAALLAGSLLRTHRLEVRNAELSRRLDEAEKNALSPQALHVEPSVKRQIKLVEAARDVHIQTETINISGEAPSNTVVTLQLAGKVLQTHQVSQGAFAFEHVPLPPANQNYHLRAQSIDIPKELPEGQKLTNGVGPAMQPTHDFNRGSRHERAIALTFDGGALANAVEPILATLAQKNVYATMFLTGRFIEKHPIATLAIADAGHEVGNHTWDHPHLTTFAHNRTQSTRPEIDRHFLQQQLHDTDTVFFALTGQHLQPIWRAPYGEHNHELREWAAAAGYRHIGWTRGQSANESLDTMDWVADSSSTNYYGSVDILQKLLALASEKDGHGLAGGIILMHLGTLRKHDPAHLILPQLIDQLRAQNYRFVRISELLRSIEQP